MFHAGFVGLIGLPNAGKSTLINALIGEKVSIVTSKPQTTRQRVMGILNDEDLQTVFVDAPGYVKARVGLNRFLHDEYLSVIEDSDVLFLLLHLDARSSEDFHELVRVAQSSKKPVLGIITKTDRREQHRICVINDLLEKAGIPAVQVAADKNPKELKEKIFPWLRQHLPRSEQPLFDPELYTTQNLKSMASEFIREQCFEFLHQEVPFGLAVHIIRFDEDQPGLTKIHGEIWVNRESHQGIVIGRGGQVLKRIGSSARKSIEEVLGHKVFLDLHVKVKKNWVRDESVMKELGYVVP